MLCRQFSGTAAPVALAAYFSLFNGPLGLHIHSSFFKECHGIDLWPRGQHRGDLHLWPPSLQRTQLSDGQSSSLPALGCSASATLKHRIACDLEANFPACPYFSFSSRYTETPAVWQGCIARGAIGTAGGDTPALCSRGFGPISSWDN